MWVYEGNMRVFCRIRPIVSKEGKKVRPLVSNDGKKRLGIRGTIVTPTLHDIHIIASRNKKVYQFDKVFLPSSTQGPFYSHFPRRFWSIIVQVVQATCCTYYSLKYTFPLI